MNKKKRIALSLAGLLIATTGLTVPVYASSKTATEKKPATISDIVASTLETDVSNTVSTTSEANNRSTTKTTKAKKQKKQKDTTTSTTTKETTATSTTSTTSTSNKNNSNKKNNNGKNKKNTTITTTTTTPTTSMTTTLTIPATTTVATTTPTTTTSATTTATTSISTTTTTSTSTSTSASTPATTTPVTTSITMPENSLWIPSWMDEPVELFVGIATQDAVDSNEIVLDPDLNNGFSTSPQDMFVFGHDYNVFIDLDDTKINDVIFLSLDGEITKFIVQTSLPGNITSDNMDIIGSDGHSLIKNLPTDKQVSLKLITCRPLFFGPNGRWVVVATAE